MNVGEIFWQRSQGKMKVCQNVTELNGIESYTSVMNERNNEFYTSYSLLHIIFHHLRI